MSNKTRIVKARRGRALSGAYVINKKIVSNLVNELEFISKASDGFLVENYKKMNIKYYYQYPLIAKQRQDFTSSIDKIQKR